MTFTSNTNRNSAMHGMGILALTVASFLVGAITSLQAQGVDARRITYHPDARYTGQTVWDVAKVKEENMDRRQVRLIQQGLGELEAVSEGHGLEAYETSRGPEDACQEGQGLSQQTVGGIPVTRSLLREISRVVTVCVCGRQPASLLGPLWRYDCAV